MQNTVAVCHAVWAHVGGPKKFCDGAWPTLETRPSLTCVTCRIWSFSVNGLGVGWFNSKIHKMRMRDSMLSGGGGYKITTYL